MHLESVRDVKQCGAFDHTARSPSKWLPGGTGSHPRVSKTNITQSIQQMHKENRQAKAYRFYVGITYLPGQSPAKYCRRR